MGVVFWDVIEEHLDEAEFAWKHWETRLGAHDDTLDGVESMFEERLLSQVDGLDAGGAPVRAKVLLPALDDAEGPRRTAAAFTLAASNDGAALAAVVARLHDDAAGPDVARALGLADAPGLRDALAATLDDPSPAARAAAMSILAFRAETPPRAQPIRADDAPVLVTAALRAALLAGDRGAAPLVRDALASPDLAVRDAAIAAGLALGVSEAWPLCRKLVAEASESTPPPALEAPLRWVAMGGAARDVESLTFLLQLAPHRPAVLRALAASGLALAVDACLPWISDTAAAPLAADAVIAITGMPLSPAALADPDPSDDSLPAPLPRLRRDAVEAWWTANQGRFHRARRTFLGRPATFETVVSVLSHGPMRRRAPLAEELLLRSRGLARVETSAFASRQRADIARLRAPAVAFDQPLG